MKSWSKLYLLALSLSLLALPALADWQTATVATGNEVAGMAVDPLRNRIFTANNLSGTAGTVTVIDGRTNQTQTWVAGAQPRCLAFNPVNGQLYVSINGSATNDTVVVFDTTGTIVKKLPVKKEPYSMVVDPDNDRLYVANYESDTVSIFASDTLWLSYPVRDAPVALTLNPVNHALFIRYFNADTFGTLNLGQYSLMHLSDGTGVKDIVINAAVNKAYVSNFNTAEVTVYDCSGITPLFLKSIPVLTPTYLVSDPGAKRVYAVNTSSGSIAAIDCSTNTTVANVVVSPNTSYLAMNPVTGKLYVSNNQTYNALRIIDWRSGGALDSVILSRPPARVVLNPVTNKIYTAYYNSGSSDSLAVIDGSDYADTKVTAKMYTCAAAVNQVTGDAFFVNYGSDTVTVIKSTGAIASIAVGDEPLAAAVNPLTNKIFVCNYNSKSVSVINGSTYSVERTIAVDSLPYSIAVNPLTNYIYVGSWLASGSRIKVIDGKDWDTSSVQAGPKHSALAVNQATNRIYVCNYGSNTVSVIEGAHHTLLATVDAGTNPYSIAVNTSLNKIYVANGSSSNVTVINGADNTAATVIAGASPRWVAVNSANNKAYVTNFDDGTVTEIDGATNAASTIAVGANPAGIGADPVTGKVFVANNGSASLGVIDCASGKMTATVATDGYPGQVAVNPVIGKAYATCANPSGSITIVDQTVEQDTRVNTKDLAVDLDLPMAYMTPVPYQDRPQESYNHWTPNKTGILGGVFSLAASQSYWKFGQNSSVTDSSLAWGTLSWGVDTAIYGENILRRYALETQSATTNNLGQGTPFAGNVLNTMLYRIDYEGPTIAWWDSLADDNDSLGGYGPYTVRSVITDFSGVDSAVLYYSLTGAGKELPYATMVKSQGDTFSAVIPAVPLAPGDTAYFDYNIKVWDHANGANTTNAANNTTTSSRRFYLRNLTGVEGNPTEANLPKTFALQAAYPNPSKGQTTIKYQLPKASNVRLQVYNVAGQLVKTIDQGQKPAGYHQINWKDSALSNGIYFYKLNAGDFSATRKLVLVR